MNAFLHGKGSYNTGVLEVQCSTGRGASTDEEAPSDRRRPSRMAASAAPAISLPQIAGDRRACAYRELETSQRSNQRSIAVSTRARSAGGSFRSSW